MSVEKVKPVMDRVLVRRAPAVTQVGMIQLREQDAERPSKGTVVAVGPGWRTPYGDIIKPSVAVGEVIYFNTYAGHNVKIDGEMLLMLGEPEILCVEEA